MTNRILFVEDNDSKYESVCALIVEVLPKSWEVYRANTMVEAERMLFEHSWSLFLLDVSLDVTSRSAEIGSLPQATLGGLNLANTIAIEGLEEPTIIITGFDSFSNVPPGKKVNNLMDLRHVDQRAQEVLGKSYLGCVRYSTEAWRDDLKELLKEVF